MARCLPSAVVLVVGLMGASLALQGWRSKSVNFDLITTMDAGRALLEHGRIPDRGVLTSFASFVPPGGVWLMTPGMLVFRDPRLFEFVGAVGLYFGTLAGLFVLGRRYLGVSCALLAVVLYGWSELGLSAAGSLWQRFPIHCFYVWFAYWTARWIESNDARLLGAAIVTWAAGMYAFMEMAPAIFILPIVWIFYRPRVRFVPLLFATLLAGVIWSPYLIFEKDRHFIDVKSQVLRKEILPAHYNESWCNPQLAVALWPTDARLRSASGEHAGPDTVSRSIRRRVHDAAVRSHIVFQHLLFSTFRANTTLRGTDFLLFAMTVVGLLVFAVSPLKQTAADAVDHDPVRWARGLMWIGITSIVSGLLLNEILLARLGSADGVLDSSTIAAIRTLQGSLCVAGLALVLARRPLSALVVRVIDASGGHEKARIVLAVSLIVPWSIMLLISDAERLSRFWWMWPIQAMAIAAVVTHLPTRLRAGRWIIWTGCLILVLIVAGRPVVGRLNSWRTEGWSGHDPALIKVVDHVGSLVRSEGRDSASIGYELYFQKFEAAFNKADPRYLVGADFDLLLRHRHGISNLSHCAEGFSVADDYRIVQTRPTNDLQQDRLYVPRGDDFRTTLELGPYQVLQRHSARIYTR